MSANLIVDLGDTSLGGNSINGGLVLSGGVITPCSGTLVGAGVDMNNANTFCNLVVAGTFTSGLLSLRVQCADSDVSGSYTDPTSGLAQMPTAFSAASGGGSLWIINSGANNTINGQTWASGLQAISSGFQAAAGFQRTGRFVRALALSGDFACGPVAVGFLSQLRTTGSGGGYSPSPGSGGVNV